MLHPPVPLCNIQGYFHSDTSHSRMYCHSLLPTLWYGLCWANPLMLVEQKLVVNHTSQDDRVETFFGYICCAVE